MITLNRSDYAAAGSSNAYRTVTVIKKRADIFDCNGEKLTGDRLIRKGAVRPTEKAYSVLHKLLASEEFERVSGSVKKGIPVCVTLPVDPLCEDIDCFEVPLRYGGTASHLIGYTADAGKGVSGLEKSFDNFLKENSSEISVRYAVDASGRALSEKRTIKDTLTTSEAGVYLTLDRAIQKATEDAMDEGGIDCGAAVVIDTETGDIKALVSRPDFDPDHVEEALDAEGSPLLNKALCAYSVGSVFKPFVAAAGIENKADENFVFDCKGECELSGTTFRCVGSKAHKKTSLTSALTKSCNLYFIRFAGMIEKQSLIELCSDFGFGKHLSLCDGIESDPGVLPDAGELYNPGDYANFAFGQGSFSASPVQLAAAYAALVSDGVYKAPNLIKGTLGSSGIFKEYGRNGGVRVISEKTAGKLRTMLYRVIEDGCTAAKPLFTSAGGKTGTAQSGIYDGGREICRTWFAGFFPADEPEYVAVILKEDGTSGSRDCAPVFRRIADEICSGELCSR